MERVVVIAHREIGEGWRVLLVRRKAQPRWAVAWFDEVAEALVAESEEGAEATHAGLEELAGALDWTDHDTARAAYESTGGGPSQRGHTLWIAIGQPVEP